MTIRELEEVRAKDDAFIDPRRTLDRLFICRQENLDLHNKLEKTRRVLGLIARERIHGDITELCLKALEDTK